MDDEQIERETRSRLFLYRMSSMDRFRLECDILDAFKDGGTSADIDYADCCLAVRSLIDSGYLRCGITKDLEETFRTTDAGRNYLYRVRQNLDANP